MTHRVIMVGVVSILLVALTACSVAPSSKGDIETAQRAQESEAQRFAYLIQFAGGRYLADPALSEYISAIGQRLARLGGFSGLDYRFYIVDSDAENGWISPAGEVAITRGMLLALDNEAELAALLAHLLSHAANQHQQPFLQREVLVSPQFLQQGAQHPYGREVVEGALESLAAHTIEYSGVLEQQADQQAIKLMVMAGYDPQAAVDLQSKWLDQAPAGRSLWLHHHPASQERLAASRKAAHGQVRDLLLAKSSYQKALSQLHADQPLRQRLNEAQQHLVQQPELAYQAVAALLRDNPGRAELHAVAAEALLENGELARSLEAYDTAIALQPDYYLYHLRHGELLMMEGDLVTAQQRLSNSLSLLPTAKGYLLLAELMERSAKLALAQRYYEFAGQANSELGREALRQAKRVDFAENPDRYILIKQQPQSSETLTLFITNINPYAVDLQSLLLSAGGNYRIKLDKVIPAGQSITSTVTIRGLAKVERIRVDRAELLP